MPAPPLSEGELASLTDLERDRVQRIGAFMTEDCRQVQVEAHLWVRAVSQSAVLSWLLTIARMVP